MDYNKGILYLNNVMIGGGAVTRRKSQVLTILVLSMAVTAGGLISGCEKKTMRQASMPSQPPAPSRTVYRSTPKPSSPEAVLQQPYQDRLQAAFPFGDGSYYLIPWRSYMDTWPASRLTNCIGINFNVPSWEANATAEVLAKAGFRHARMEVGWGSMSYKHPGQLRDVKSIVTMLHALQRWHIRPLILLNANSGYPCPIRWTRAVLAKAAPVGAREIYFKSTAGLKPGYSGLQGQAYQMGYPVITAVNAKTGRCTLSAPLAKALKAGPINIPTRKYQPFAEEVFADGKPNPAAWQTVQGWMTYVKGICTTVRQALGTKGKANAGFDLEVWNELGFGSQFLNIEIYYNPPLKFQHPMPTNGNCRWFLPGLSYHSHGLTRTGDEIILPMTVDYVRNPANGLPGVKVIDGFSNITPWANGAGMWPGQTGFSRHYYTGYDPHQLQISPKHPYMKYGTLINALGGQDRRSGEVQHVWGRLDALDPGKFFIPSFKMSQPEMWYFGYHTESVVRDLQPFPSPFGGHFRFANPGNGQATEVWMTECNFWRRMWANQLEKETHVVRNNPQLHALMEYEAAKMDLRQFVFQSAKGLSVECMFAAKGHDDGFGVLPDSFWTALKQSHGKLTAVSLAHTGYQIKVLSRLTRLFAAGSPLAVPCPLTVKKLVEHRPLLVFKGDGTPEHPNIYNRDDFACLPFEFSASRYAVVYYVVTRNVTHSWNKKDGLLDPARYNMPAQVFDLTLGNICGTGATVSAYDPMTGKTLPVRVLAGTRNSLTVRLATVDYPRFLLIKEARPSPLILAPHLAVQSNGAARVSFKTNVIAPAMVTWGELPIRTRDGQMRLPAAVAANKTLAYQIPNLRPQAGVRLTIHSHGLTARWPIWGFDVAGVNWPHRTNYAIGPGPTAEKTAIYVPPLPPIPARPAGYTAQAPKGLVWAHPANGVSTLQVGTGSTMVRVRLRVIPRPANVPDGVINVLPELFVPDRIQAFVVFRWHDAAAWFIHLQLNPASHPLTKELTRTYMIAPLQHGWLKLSFAGTADGMARWGKVIRAVQQGIHFN